MRYFLFFAGLVAVVSGDVGYTYLAPQSSISQSQNAPGAQNNLFNGASSGITSFVQSVSSPGLSSQSNNFGSLSSGSFSSPNFEQRLPNVQSFGPNFVESPATVHKHIYVHIPPPEPLAPSRPIVLPPVQKHYKIIFVKVPTAQAVPSPAVTQLLQQPQQEEKTIVYVLVNKPDAPKPLPTPAPTQPSKPEVYFIKYNTKKTITPSNEGSSLLSSGLSNVGLESANLGSLNNLGSLGSSSNIGSLNSVSLGAVNAHSSGSQLGHAEYGPPLKF